MTNKTDKTQQAQKIQKKSWMKSTAISPANFLVASLALTGSLITANTAYAVGNNATPTGETVVAGAATFNRPSTGVLNVTQSTQRVVIDWDKFNIGKNAKTKFVQPNATSMAVNRVTGPGNDPTKILGTLKSNGNVMILDSNGVLFGSKSVIDVGGLVASTGDIDVTKFMNGDMQITLDSVDTGSVINKGAISIKDGGLLAFVAPHVANNGTITARLGRVSLAAGSKAVLDFSGDQLVQIALTDELETALVENTGSIIAAGSRVELTARAAKTAVDTVINMDGIIKADSFDVKGGKIILDGGRKGKVVVAGKMESKGRIANNSTRNAAIALGLADGTEARKAKGGAVNVYGQAIELGALSRINTAGTHGGGTVNIGNAATSSVRVANGARIVSRALQYGNAGTINITSSDLTDFSGFIDARGGDTQGNGGDVSISSAGKLTYTGEVNASARNGAMGTTTLDPADIVVWDGFGAMPTGSFVNAQSLAQTLGLSNVHIIAGNSIVLIDDLDLSHYNLGVDVTTGNLTLTSNAVTFNDLTMGTGDVFMNAGTVNMDGVIFGSDGSVIDATRLHNTARVVNVLSNEARIQQAIDMALTGTNVNVQAGTHGAYQENIVVNKTLNLNANAAVMMGTTANGDIIRVTADDVTVYGFELRAEIVGSLDKSANGVAIYGDRATVENSAIYGMANAGIYSANNTGTEIKTNVINGGKSGVYTNNVTKAVIDGNNFEDTDVYAVRSYNSEGIKIENNTIVNATGTGIYFNGTTGQAKARIALNEIIGGAVTGITVTGTIHTDVLSNEITGITGNGINLYNTTALVNVNGNYISNASGHGIVINGNTGNARMNSNRIVNAGKNGVHIMGGTGMNWLARNTISSAGLSGIYATGVNQLQSAVNKISESGAAGIRIENSNGAFYSSSDTISNGLGDGISIKNTTGMSVDAATISGHKYGQGVNVENSNTTTIQTSTISKGALNGIKISGGRGVTLFNNTLNDLGGNGIVVGNGTSALDIRNNSVYGVVNDGIQLHNIDNAQIRYNRTSSARNGNSIGRDFININGGTANQITNNTIGSFGAVLATGRDGIHLENDIRTNVAGNKIKFTDNPRAVAGLMTHAYATRISGGATIGRDAINLSNSVGSSISGNHINANGSGMAATRDGIHLQGGLNVTINSNTISGAVNMMSSTSLSPLDSAGAGNDGIHVENSTSTRISYNNIFGSMVSGPFMGDTKTAYGAKRHGIYVSQGHDTNITSNNIYATKETSFDAPLMATSALTGEPMPVVEPTPMNVLVAAGAGEHGIYVDNSTVTNITENQIYALSKHFGGFPSPDFASVSTHPPMVTQQVMAAVKNAIYVTGNTDTAIAGNAIEARNALSGPMGLVSAPIAKPIDGSAYYGAGQNGIHAVNETNLRINGNSVGGSGTSNMMGAQENGIFVENSRRAFIGNNSFFASFGAMAAGDNGIYVLNSKGAEIAKNTFNAHHGSTLIGENGIQVVDSKNADIISNSFFSDGYGLATGRDGIYLNSSAGSTIAYNTVVTKSAPKPEPEPEPEFAMTSMMASSTTFGRHGIVVDNAPRANVHHNTIAGATRDGMRIHQSNKSNIHDNTIGNVGENGIVLTADERTKLLRNTVSDTGLRGIYVFNSINNMIKANIISDTGSYGIHVHKSGYATLLSNETDQTGKAGIRVEKTDNATVKRNDIHDSYNYNGINIINSDDVKVQGNHVFAANTNGIRIAGSERATVKNNVVEYAGQDGIHIINSDHASLEFNEVYDSGENGIYVDNSDDALLEGNLIDVTADDGIDITDSNGARLIRNDVYNADDDGIDIKGARDIKIIDNYAIDSGDNGIELSDTRKARILGNFISGSGVEGIEGDDVTNLRIRGNRIVKTSSDAINIDDGKNVHVTGNTIKHAGDEGIEFDDSSNIRVINNRIIDTGDAIEFDRVDDFVIARNKIKSAWNGIDIDNVSDGLVLANIISNARNYGIRVDDANDIDVHNNEIRGLSFPQPTMEPTLMPTSAPRLMGKVKSSGTGIYISDSDDVSVQRNIVNDMHTGISLDNTDDMIVAQNLVNNSHTGFVAGGSHNEDITFDGNVFVNNTFGAVFNSGVVTFAGVNQFIGGNTALTFSPVPQYGMYKNKVAAMDEPYPDGTMEPMMWSRLELVDNTIGQTKFVGQSNYYINLENGAFFDPDKPTIIDATDAKFDDVDGGLMTAAQLRAIEDMINDYDDRDTLGQIFAGFTNTIDPSDLFLDDLANLIQLKTQGRVTIVNLPFIPGANGQINPADLANLSPAAGGDDETDPEALSNMEPAAGNEEVQCWAQLGQKVGLGAVTFNFDASPEAVLAGQAACGSI